MTVLDPKYVSSTPFQWTFRDKDTGAPLAGGVVTFYTDSSKTVLKPVFQLSDSPPNTFTELNNPITLTSIGTFADNNGNDIIPYFYPYDDDGNIQLYYVTVVSATGVPQFVREDWPPDAFSGGAVINQNELINFVPNPQFLLHNPAPYTSTTSGSNTIYYVAPGGWNFIAPTSPTSLTNITFFQELSASPQPNIDANPRYVIQVQTTTVGTDTVKDLELLFPDVNKFSSDGDITNPNSVYTLSFQGLATTVASVSVELILRKFYGTGSSLGTVDLLLTSIVINPDQSVYNYSFTFGSNDGDTVGTLNDDYVALILRFPEQLATVRLSDFVLTPGTVNVTAFPQTTNATMIAESTIGWLPTPAYDGSDLYLPIVLTPQGSIVDHSIVGTIIGKTQAAPLINELNMDGSVYIASKTNALSGIPYQRLMNFLLLNSPAVTIGSGTILANTVPMFGTGANFVTLYNVSGSPTHFYVGINTTGGGGSATAVSASITISAVSANNYYEATVASVPLASDYWTFTDGTTNLVYNVWYSVNGVGIAPATPTGANIQVKLVSADTTTTTANKTIAAVNQYQFLLPNLQGLFLRGYDPAGLYDQNTSTRTISGITLNNTVFTGNNIGSFEAAAFLNHTHIPGTGFTNFAGTQPGGPAAIPGAGSGFGGATVTGLSGLGGAETRPVNFSVNWFIKY